MARNNLGRLFTSISNLSAPPNLSPFTKSEPVFSNSVSRLISSSPSSTQQSRQQQQQQPHREENPNEEQERVKANHTDDQDQEDGEEDDDFVNKQTGEVGGPRGPEPTRYGDWERNGRCYDF